MNARHVRKVRRSVALVAAILFPAVASAVPLPLGDTFLPGTTVAARPELAGPIVADVLKPYGFISSSGTLADFGEVQSRVVRETLTGTLDFYWRILPSGNPLENPIIADGEVIALRIDGFNGYVSDGDWRIDGLGNVPPKIGRNLGSGTVNFLFDPGVRVGDESNFFFLHTQATQYAEVGQYDLLGAPTGFVSPLFSTFAPAVPEPTAWLLGGLGVAGAAVMRHRAGRRR